MMKYTLKLKEEVSAESSYSLKYRKQVLSLLNKSIGLKFFLTKHTNKAFIRELYDFLRYFKDLPESKVKIMIYSVDWSNIYLMNVLNDSDWSEFIVNNVIGSSPGAYFSKSPAAYFKCYALGETHYASEMIGYGNVPTSKVVKFDSILENLNSTNIISLPVEFYDKEMYKMKLSLTYIKAMNDDIDIVLRFFEPDSLSYIIVKKKYLKEFVLFFNRYSRYHQLKRFVPTPKDIAIVRSIVSKGK